jgi:putative membrane protein
MEHMFEIGFLGTRAPLFMDIIVIIVALLPFLISLNIWLAVKKRFNLHRILQIVLFLITLVVLVYFEYGMQSTGGFEFYIKESSIDSNLAFIFLIFHIIIAFVMLIMWFSLLKFAGADNKRRALPGMYSRDHKASGRRVAFMILLTSITGIIVYWILFIA